MAQDITTPEQMAERRSKDYTGVLWHGATFVIINALFWTLDLMTGGLDWAYWITLFWGIALLFHIAWYLIDVSAQERSYRKFLANEEHNAST